MVFVLWRKNDSTFAYRSRRSFDNRLYLARLGPQYSLGWFILPFFGGPVLTVPMAIGVVLVVTFLTYHYAYNPDDREPSEKIATAATYVFLLPLLMLGMGWVVHLFL